MARITGCCGCFDLHYGAIASGVASLTIMCFTLGYSLFTVITILSISPQYFQLVPLMGGVLGASIVISAIGITFNSLLIHGVKTGRRSMVLSRLIFSFIYLPLMTLGVIGYIVYMAINLDGVSNHPHGDAIIAPYVMVCLVLVGLVTAEWYWQFIVWHYFQSMPTGDVQTQVPFPYKPQTNVRLEMNGAPYAGAA